MLVYYSSMYDILNPVVNTSHKVRKRYIALTSSKIVTKCIFRLHLNRNGEQ